MKKRTLLLLLSILALLSCKNTNDAKPSNKYYLTAKLDGKQTDFSTEFAGYNWTQSAPYNLIVTGYQNKNFRLPAIDIEVQNATNTIKTGTYIEPNQERLCRYAVSTNEVYTANNNVLNDFEVKILELTNKDVKGTFEGTITDFKTKISIKITEGRFYVPFD
ncbi:MAG: hypothetical protein MUF45_11370 [Spirosomaceae bacterium]|jgi:hypothetical protein|nr:hypothetical protein [Spirosomataceae bacterium]